MILGIGLGHVMAPDFFRTYGVDDREAVRRFNEGVRVLKSLWTEPVTNFAGEFYQLQRAGMWPKPVQKPHPPLWFGGQHPDALRRAVRHADGYTCAGPNTTDGLKITNAGPSAHPLRTRCSPWPLLRR